MGLKLVTFCVDGTQFLVNARDNGTAIRKAINANLDSELGSCEEILMDADDPDCFIVEPVNDIRLLDEIMDRKDRYGVVQEAIVFWG